MKKTIIGKGKTIDEAISNGLKELGLTRFEVESKVLEYPESGVFGLFGKKGAIVELTVVNNCGERAKSFLDSMFKAMDLTAEIETRLEGQTLFVNISGEEMGIIIGKRGQTLDKIQYLTGLVVNRQGGDYIRVVLDTENYREKRENVLVGVANKTADKVQRYHRRFSLEPMSPGERRIIHATLQNHPKVFSYSEGEEPYRYVVIDLK